jgi:cytochrome c oxidase subunit 2
MVVPSRIHIRFLVTSNDVLHSFAIPAAGIKIDAVPGRLNQVSAYFLYEGTFFGQCSELCGVNHGFMPIEVKVLKSNEFLQWRLDHKNEGPESDYLA